MYLRTRKQPSGAVTFSVYYGRVDGRRKEVSFGGDRAAAEAEMARVLRAEARHGEMGRLASGPEMAEFLALKAEVEKMGSTLPEVVAFYREHGTGLRERVEMGELVQRYLWAKREARLSARTIETLKFYVGPLGLLFAGRMADEVTGREIEGWLAGQGWKGETQNIALGHTRTFCRWALKRGHLRVDPTAAVEARAEGEEEEIVTLSLAQCERLLKAVESGFADLAGYVALGLFCGIRRAELERLQWCQVNVEEGTVVVLAKQAKGRRKLGVRARRVIDLPAAAVAWLGVSPELVDGRPRAPDKRVVCNLKRKLPLLCAQAGLPAWPKNALRHTFASMHYAMHQDEAQLQAMMGHESREMLHKHYRALKTRKEAERFWGLRPAAKG